MATIIGDNNNNVLNGTSGDDQIFALGGDDTIKGSRGNDSLDGGDGNDTADYSKLGKSISVSALGKVTKGGGFGTDTLLKIETIIADASVSNNTIDGSNALPGVSLNVNLENQKVVINGAPGAALKVVNFNDVKGTNLDDVIIGDKQDNKLFGNDGNDTIRGGGGNDILDGGNGNDRLIGGAGKDTLRGGNGNDTLIGGGGNDILRGGLGADKFVFNSLSDGIDIIKDFKFAQGDIIQVSKSGFGASSINDFSYNPLNGNLSFLGSTFAVVENLASNVNIQFA